MPAIRNREDLINLGSAMYGGLWQTHVAKAVGRAHNQIWRWAKGAIPADEELLKLCAACRDKEEELRKKRQAIERRLGKKHARKSADSADPENPDHPES